MASNFEHYYTQTLAALEGHNQRLDAQIQALRAEKTHVKTAMDRHIHRDNASAIWAEMPEPQRIAMKQIAQEG